MILRDHTVNDNFTGPKRTTIYPTIFSSRLILAIDPLTSKQHYTIKMDFGVGTVPTKNECI